MLPVLLCAALIAALPAFRPFASPPPMPTATGPAEAGTRPQSIALKAEVDSLHAAMIAAFKRDPASVAQFYTDDASILGGGGRWIGREEVNKYWSQGPTPTDWILEVLEVGGDSQSPWVRGRSTIVGQGGRRMVTDYIGILKRQPDRRLKFYIDMFVGPPMMRPPGAQ